MKCRKKSAVGIALALVGASLASGAHAASCLDTYARARQIQNVEKTSDTLVLAHRGLWGPHNNSIYTPENSLGAMEAADAACVDGIELDVKTTYDGTPIVMHDFNLGRTTNVYAHVNGSKYDPMTNTGSNPTVASLPWSTIRNLRLLTSNRAQASIFTVPSVADAVHQWGVAVNPAPLVFDIKTALAARTVDIVVSTILPTTALRNTMTMKVNATTFPTPADFHGSVKHVKGLPVFTTNMLGKINVDASLEAWMAEAGTIEVNVKQPGGLLSHQKNVLGARGKKVGVFHALPDGPIAGQFYNADGHCCYKLSDLYYHHTTGADTDDRRGDLHYLYDQGFYLITSDDPRGTVKFMGQNGRRKTHLSVLP